MSALQAFDFETTPVRTLMKDQEPWFVGSDVCAALEIKNPWDAMKRLDDDERADLGIVDVRGEQTRKTIIISEPGCYRLVFTSRTEAAERFKRWLAHEVLPALRREGTFCVARPLADNDDDAADDDLPMNADTKLWGLRLGKIRAAASLISTVARIYGPEAARKLYEAEPALPDLRRMSIASLAGSEEDDATGCLLHLMRFGLSPTMTVGRLLGLALNDTCSRRGLIPHGIIVEPSGHKEQVLVAGKHRFLTRAFAGTQWRQEWRFALINLHGARMLDGMRRFGSENSGGVLIPFGIIRDATMKGGPLAPPPA